MELSKRDLPKVGDRNAIREFAASFNGYQHFGSFKACAEAAKAMRRETLLDLRNELFLSYRASNHVGDDGFVNAYAELYPLFLRALRNQ